MHGTVLVALNGYEGFSGVSSQWRLKKFPEEGTHSKVNQSINQSINLLAHQQSAQKKPDQGSQAFCL
jgi:hypothetical protein